MRNEVETEGCLGSSGAVRVTDPNPEASPGQAWLGTLLSGQLQMKTDGWLHVYIGNGSSMDIAYRSSGTTAMCPLLIRLDGSARDQSLRSLLKAQFTLVNEHLRVASTTQISGFTDGQATGQGKKYENMYTGKELQTGEYWKASVSTGLEMYDYSLSLFAFKGARETASLSFEARFFDPQLGRWVVPDPAEQFANPYLAMGNNPVLYTDPDGQFAFLLPIFQAVFIGAAVGGASYTAQVAFSDGGFENFDNRAFARSVGIGGISGAASYGIGQANLGEFNSSVAHGLSQGFISEFTGGDFESGFGSAVFGSFASSTLIEGGGSFGNSKFGNIALSGLAGGIGAQASGGDFWTGVGVGATVAGLNHMMHKPNPMNPERLREIILEDGKLTLEEANLWYRFGQGQALKVDGSLIDLDFVNPDDWRLNELKSVQTLFQSRDGMVYGQLDLTYEGHNQFSIAPNEYDFRMHSGPGTGFRNFLTRFGKFIAGNGMSYWINFYNFNTVNYSPPLSYPNGFKL